MWALAFGAALGACGDSPEERFAQAQAAAKQKDEAAFKGFFTEKSAALLRGFERAGKRSKLWYTRNLFALLPSGEVDEVFVKDNFALITVKSGAKKKEVRMYKQNGQWAIDLFSLDTLWAPLEKQ